MKDKGNLSAVRRAARAEKASRAHTKATVSDQLLKLKRGDEALDRVYQREYFGRR